MFGLAETLITIPIIKFLHFIFCSTIIQLSFYLRLFKQHFPQLKEFCNKNMFLQVRSTSIHFCKPSSRSNQYVHSTHSSTIPMLKKCSKLYYFFGIYALSQYILLYGYIKSRTFKIESIINKAKDPSRKRLQIQ